MKNCPHCGASLPDENKFCTACGQPQPAPQPQYAAPVVNAAPVARESTWDGTVLDTILNTIVASLMITFTCGIATPWAICYIMRFVAKHAVIDGRRLKFDGNGAQLFGQWIKWFLLTVITCGIYSFWVTPRMYKWVCSHLHVQ